MQKLLSLLPLLALLLAGCAQPQPVAEHNHAVEEDPMTAGTVLNPPTEVADFTMPSSTGAPLGLADLKGRPTLVFFGFTNCPDVCPASAATSGSTTRSSRRPPTAATTWPTAPPPTCSTARAG
jgi:cytochrome oxidase Cu insertion factor (SCO1/SenC/PrrC family)